MKRLGKRERAAKRALNNLWGEHKSDIVSRNLDAGQPRKSVLMGTSEFRLLSAKGGSLSDRHARFNDPSNMKRPAKA